MKRAGMILAVTACACGGADERDLYGNQARPPAVDAASVHAESGAAEIDAGADAAGGAGGVGGVGGVGGLGGVDAAAPAEAGGAACWLDSDCTPLLCNWKTSTCAAPAPAGTGCLRDVECQSDVCHFIHDVCIEPQPAGATCGRGSECASGKCSSLFVCL